MTFQRSPIAVLLFSLPSKLDAARKALTRQGTGQDRALWKTLHQLTQAKVNAAGLPCVSSAHVVPAPDYLASFGQQLQTAVSATLAQGYERVIVIGNDCPDLRVSDLRAAADALAQGKLPVGYDRRGGVFLLGLDRRFLLAGSIPTSHSFETLPWQTNQLGAALIGYLSRAFGSVVCLSAVRTDWNERADLRAGDWLRGAFAGLAHRLWTLVAPIARPFTAPNFSFSSLSGRIDSLRAPPVAA